MIRILFSRKRLPLRSTLVWEHSASRIRKKHGSAELNLLISAYRSHGHKTAMLNPLSSRVKRRQELCLNPSTYGLNINDDYELSIDGLLSLGSCEMNLQGIIMNLDHIYCSHIGIEATHLPKEESDWFHQQFESIQTLKTFSEVERMSIVKELIRAQAFEKFLSVKFANVKRYGLQGAETMITFFQILFQKCASGDLSDVVITMSHRGRLTILYTLLEFPPCLIFRKMQGYSEFPEDCNSTGDVLSHLRNSITLDLGAKTLNVSLLPNPSHLEAAAPMVVGKVRSMLQKLKLGEYSGDFHTLNKKVLAVQVHGDAAFTGQGVIMETLAMSNVANFKVGGSVHLIVNNQIGYTTTSDQGRSSSYCSDIMKMIEAPIIHVNGAFPEEVAKAAILALSYQQKFGKDVLVDLFCFRRQGHNEMDDPSFTNPIMYHIIDKLKSFPDAYCDVLEIEGLITDKEKIKLESECLKMLDENLEQSLAKDFKFTNIKKDLKIINKATKSLSTWDTGVPISLLRYVAVKSVLVPAGFKLHGTLKRHFVEERLKKIESGYNIDWATAEALALGSLLSQGFNVRLSGQDVGRGTFSQRHFLITDQETGKTYLPLNHIHQLQSTFLEVAHSILSEEAVLAFEYGFSIDNPGTLVIWEAQFGDFFNSAQVVFDTFISSGETKWLIHSGIVILLPHGYDGGGPEHSSCRLERFLQMSDSSENEIDGDEVNWFVVNPSTPSQFFHLLRKQVICNHRKPLIVVAPKVILRHPLAVSQLKDFSPGMIFKPVISSYLTAPEKIRSIIFCSGKHYYNLFKEQEMKKRIDTAIVRLEQLCPFPAEALAMVIKKFKNAQYFTWSQEEPQNMGAWCFVQMRFQNILGIKLKYAGRRPLSTPAVGISKLHHMETQDILIKSFVL